jgi:hypothetical protein
MLSVEPEKYWQFLPNRRLRHGSLISPKLRPPRSRMICCAILKAGVQEIGITRHRKLVGMLLGFESEEDWIDDRL